MTSWFRGLSMRERIMVSALGVFVCLFVMYFVLWRPVDGWAQATHARKERAANTLMLVEQAKSAVPQKRRVAVPRAGEPLRRAVTQSAAAAGIELLRIGKEDEGRLEVQPAPVDSDVLFAWFSELEFNYGVIVRYADVLRADDGAANAAVIEFERQS